MTWPTNLPNSQLYYLVTPTYNSAYNCLVYWTSSITERPWFLFSDFEQLCKEMGKKKEEIINNVLPLSPNRILESIRKLDDNKSIVVYVETPYLLAKMLEFEPSIAEAIKEKPLLKFMFFVGLDTNYQYIHYIHEQLHQNWIGMELAEHNYNNYYTRTLTWPEAELWLGLKTEKCILYTNRKINLPHDNYVNSNRFNNWLNDPNSTLLVTNKINIPLSNKIHRLIIDSPITIDVYLYLLAAVNPACTQAIDVHIWFIEDPIKPYIKLLKQDIKTQQQTYQGLIDNAKYTVFSNGYHSLEIRRKN